MKPEGVATALICRISWKPSRRSPVSSSRLTRLRLWDVRGENHRPRSVKRWLREQTGLSLLKAGHFEQCGLIKRGLNFQEEKTWESGSFGN
jgi:hypothetical protein